MVVAVTILWTVAMAMTSSTVLRETIPSSAEKGMIIWKQVVVMILSMVMMGRTG
jgi:hypothetical protein